MPERDTTPTRPGLWMYPGMMPILHSPGVITPGQLGPIRRELERLRRSATRTMSSTGMPSVMATIISIPAPIASSMAAAANLGGP